MNYVLYHRNHIAILMLVLSISNEIEESHFMREFFHLNLSQVESNAFQNEIDIRK
jgi:hypothetical protein